MAIISLYLDTRDIAGGGTPNIKNLTVIKVIGKRLNAILSNWRERNSTELLIALSLWLSHLSLKDRQVRAEALLKIARDGGKSGAATDADALQRAAMYGLWCIGRPFAMHISRLHVTWSCCWMQTITAYLSAGSLRQRVASCAETA